MNDSKIIDDPFVAMQEMSEIRHRTSDVDIGDGFIVTLKSLGAKDETDSFIECMNFWGQAFLYKHKIETIVRSMYAINNIPFHTADVSDEEKKKIIEEKKKIVSSWHQTVIDDLYVEYAKLSGNVDEFLDKMALTAETNSVGLQDAEEKRKLMTSDSTNLDEGQENEE